jgi:biopolymer transport protein TolR
MGMSIKTSASGGRRRARGIRHQAMSEINVTPMVDVMLVLLIIFMVAAPLMQVGIPLELPQSKGAQLQAPKTEPIIVSVSKEGKVFLAESELRVEDIEVKLKAIAGNNPTEQTIYVRGDKGVPYGAVMKVMGRIQAAGFKKLSFVNEEEGG